MSDKATLQDLMLRVKDLESQARSRGAQMVRVGAMSNGGGSGGSDGGTGGGGCCCNEFDCIRVPGIPDSVVITPEYYEFTPSTLTCGCDPAPGARVKVKLYRPDLDDLTVWESLHGEDDDPPMCLGTTAEVVDCTVTATWIWVLDPTECVGTCEYNSADDPEAGLYWQIDLAETDCTGNNCLEQPCGCKSALSEANGDDVTDPTGLGQELSTPCGNTADDLSCAPGHWEFVSVDDEDCNCTPVEPDFDGTEADQTATTTCDGTKVVDSSETLLPAWWRLTVVSALGPYGCDETVLEFIIGINVVLTFPLLNACAETFCPRCVNSFKLTTCLPRCTDGPTVICLKPVRPNRIEGDFGSQSCCNAPPYAPTGLPAAYLLPAGSLPISQAEMDAWLASGFCSGVAFGAIAFDVNLISGAFLLHWNQDIHDADSDQYPWISDKIPLNSFSCFGGTYRYYARIVFSKNVDLGTGEWTCGMSMGVGVEKISGTGDPTCLTAVCSGTIGGVEDVNFRDCDSEVFVVTRAGFSMTGTITLNPAVFTP